MPTRYTIHRLPPRRLWREGSEPYLGPRWCTDESQPQCDALVGSDTSKPYRPTRWWQCSWAAKANGLCRKHQYLARKGFGMNFFVVVAEDCEPLPEVFGSLDEAKRASAVLARQTGALVYICQPILSAATHQVDWSEVEQEPLTVSK